MTVDLDRRILFRWSLQIVDNLVAEIKEFIYLTRYMGQSTSVVGNVYNEFSDTVCSSNVFCGLCLIIVLSIIKSSKVVTLKTSVNGRELNFSEWYHYAVNKISSSVDLRTLTIHKAKKITKKYLLSI